MLTRVYIEEEKAFSGAERIFLGEGLFETLKVFNRKPLYPKAHWQRLKNAATFLMIPFDLSYELWTKSLQDCILQNGLQTGGLKVLLCSGHAPRGLTAHSTHSSLLLNAFQSQTKTASLHLVSAPWRRDSNNPIYKIKSTHYLEAILALRHAKNKGAEEVLFFNEKEQITETTVANFFLIKDNRVLTPSVECGLLAGIIRQRILLLCQDRNIAHNICMLEEQDILNAEAAFTANALQGIRSVDAFESKSFAKNHPMIEELYSLLNEDMESMGPIL